MGETDLDKMLNTLKPILRPGIYVYTSLRLESSRFYNTIEPRTKLQNRYMDRGYLMEAKFKSMRQNQRAK